MSFTDKLKGLAVEIIRIFWDHGHYRDNKWMRMVHDNWLGYWIDLKTSITMRSVDEQAKALTPEPEVVKPIYWEETEGETPLGGPLGYTYRFDEDNDA